MCFAGLKEHVSVCVNPSFRLSLSVIILVYEIKFISWIKNIRTEQILINANSFAIVVRWTTRRQENLSLDIIMSNDLNEI